MYIMTVLRAETLSWRVNPNGGMDQLIRLQLTVLKMSSGSIFQMVVSSPIANGTSL